METWRHGDTAHNEDTDIYDYPDISTPRGLLGFFWDTVSIL